MRVCVRNGWWWCWRSENWEGLKKKDMNERERRGKKERDGDLVIYKKSKQRMNMSECWWW